METNKSGGLHGQFTGQGLEPSPGKGMEVKRQQWESPNAQLSESKVAAKGVPSFGICTVN